MTLIDEQFQKLEVAFPGATSSRQNDGMYLVQIPNVELPEGWNLKRVAVWFVVPVGYPMGQPDCFWTEGNLRLAGGGFPQNTGWNPIPHGPSGLLWFSWHVQKWSPNFDSLLTYARVINNRFLELR